MSWSLEYTQSSTCLIESLRVELSAMLLGLAIIIPTCIAPLTAQAIWTPIYVDGNSQVDLWTETPKGCRCSFNSSRKDCACCVKDGGCSCGPEVPHRCTQCGLQRHCTNMCNITLSSQTLTTESGKTFGQVKTPSMQGPAFCWFSFIPDSNQRVEIQIYRLINVGKFNGSSCEMGFVQMIDGEDPLVTRDAAQICGANERFTPPVVLFADNGPASLIFNIEERTSRSQFLAFFSFTSTNSSQGTSYYPIGGKRIKGTDCDWVYEERACKAVNGCRLASPGFPGIYVPNRRCLYRITSSPDTTIKLKFKSLYLPHNHCNSHYVRVYGGPTTSANVLANLCGNRKQNLQFSGPDLLLEFSSGHLIHPFDFNGFAASLDFVLAQPTTVSTLAPTTRPTTSTAIAIVDEFVTAKPPSCNNEYSGEKSNLSGFIHEPRSPHWRVSPLTCYQRFIPAKNQSITIKVVSLNKASSHNNCQTACGDGGCRCFPQSGSVSTVNHVMIKADSGKSLSCVCGDFQQDWLPVGIRSWTPVSLVYHNLHVNSPAQQFTFEAQYRFHTDNICGHHVINQHSGVISAGDLLPENELNHYYYQSCTWLLDSNVERQLTVEIESNQNRPCTAWNLTLHEYSEVNPDRTGALLHVFCPRYVQKTYVLPWKLNIITIRLYALTRTPPDFQIKWKSQIVRTNTRLAGVTPAQTSSGISVHSTLCLILLPQLIIVPYIK